ncbi:MAG: cell division protein FtsQ/DivIB [Egibacteraceae bacterium]
MDARIRARRIAVCQAQARKRRRWVASVAALVLLAVAATAAARSPLFEISEIRIVGVTAEQVAQLRALVPIAVGENLLKADLGRVERRLAQVAWVRTVDAVRVPPSIVDVRVQVRQPIANVRVADAIWAVDADGIVLGPGAGTGLVEIDAPNSVLPGVGTRVSDAAVRNALAVHAALPPHRRQAVDRYDAPSERGLRLHLRVLAEDQLMGMWVRFGSVERSEQKARVLEALVLEVRKAGIPISEIDVRAPDNPVLVPGG